MEGFSYIDIFETKGIEYLAIIAFFAILIPFWLVLNKRSMVRRKVKREQALTAGSLKVPYGLYFNKNHTWTFLEKSGMAKVGLDDLLIRLTGDVQIRDFKKPGETVGRGDVLTSLVQEGRTLKIKSPISGTIVDSNQELVTDPAILNEDPYNNGWIYRIKPGNWMAETSNCMVAETAAEWTKGELNRFKDFIAFSMKKSQTDPSMVIMQDGGELCDHPLKMLPVEVWNDFQEEFLS